MNITLQKILEEYWSQTLLLITAIGFILRMIFSFILKKKEIYHGINHKNRMDALIRFFNVYAEVKSMWTKLPIYKIYRNELSDNEIDNEIQPALNKLEATVIELQIYFDDKLYENFKQIKRNMYRMNKQFLDIAFDNNSDYGLIQKTNNYTYFREDIEKENTIILTEINKLISKKYK